MDPIRTGQLIRQLRTVKNWTQKQLAERIHVSDKAVSKWERGHGCPDVSVLVGLAEALDTDMQILLSGVIRKKESEKGNMKKLKIYVCPTCGNILTATSEADVTCCGNKLAAAQPQKAGDDERLTVEETDGALFVSSDHPMTKEHFISFVAFVNDSTAILSKQYPEWNLQVTLPRIRFGRLVWYCTQHGLFYQDVYKKK